MENPAISVVIPMYNAEEFVAECLDSLLLQTFQDFEVIVVDDCSDDKGVEIVESYREKFGERLSIARTEKNSGGGGYVPRNIGLSMAHGEYVYFMDADDFIMLNALETLHAAAKEYDADVVYFSSHYWINNPKDISAYKDAATANLLEAKLEDKPTLIVDDTDRLLEEVLLKNHHRTPWTKLIKRELLTENNILFPEIIVGGDALWTFNVYAHSKRFLRLPVSLYFLRRYHSTSVVKKRRPSSKVEFDPLVTLGFIKWFKAFDELAKIIKFLRENPELCCRAAKDYFDYFVLRLKENGKNLYLNDVRDILRREFFDVEWTVPFIKLLNDEQSVTEEISPPLKSACAVSVVVSLYNYGRYVGEGLDSLLEQTFTDFEVIVVDDCSTDDGVDVVKSYFEKFGGRLKLTQTETNSGGGGMPRNIGLSLASGKYVFFMDADDALVPTALEELNAYAEKYYADVVYCEKYFTSEGVGQDFKNNARIADKKCQYPPFVSKPTFETLNMTKRVDRATRFKYWVTAWLRFVRRDLSYQVMFCSKRFLRVPDVYYIRRVHDASVSFRKREVPDHVHKWMDRTIRSLKYMDNFMGKFEFFRENPRIRHKILNHFLSSDFSCIEKECRDLETFEVYDIFLEKFGNYLGDYDVLVSALCADLNTRRKRIQRDEKLIANLNDRVTALASKKMYAISVIIPMFNAQEFIGDCLDSLLEQTFQDFEVIVVDDCSTDNGRTFVKSYIPKFGGRLKLFKTKKNSGGGGYVPRNIGLKHARGEYVYFMDADDFIMLNALEKMYAAATEYEADVVCTSAFYDLEGVNEVRRVRDIPPKDSPFKFPGRNPILTINNPDENLERLFSVESMPASWRKFIRRDVLVENEILFPEIFNGGDFIWTINLYCRAKRILRISTPLYFYRSYTPESILRKKRKREEQISYWVSAFVAWSQALDELAKRIDILRSNSEYCHRALMLKFKWCIGHLTEEVKRLYSSKIYEILCRELSVGKDSPYLSTLAFFFGDIVLERRRITKLKERIEELEKKPVKKLEKTPVKKPVKKPAKPKTKE